MCRGYLVPAHQYTTIMVDTLKIPDCIAYFQTIEQLTTGKQNVFYKWLIDTAKEVNPVNPVPKGLHIASKRKQRCFSNSARIAIDNPDVLYVEGYMDCNGMFIEHAWNRTTSGIHFDVTVNDNTMKYYQVLELGFNDVIDMIEHNNSRFGPFLMKYFYKNIYKP